MSVSVRTVIEPSAPGVGGMVVLHVRSVGAMGMLPAGSTVGRWKCLRMGQVTEVEGVLVCAPALTTYHQIFVSAASFNCVAKLETSHALR